MLSNSRPRHIKFRVLLSPEVFGKINSGRYQHVVIRYSNITSGKQPMRLGHNHLVIGPDIQSFGLSQKITPEIIKLPGITHENMPAFDIAIPELDIIFKCLPYVQLHDQFSCTRGKPPHIHNKIIKSAWTVGDTRLCRITHTNVIVELQFTDTIRKTNRLIHIQIRHIHKLQLSGPPINIFINRIIMIIGQSLSGIELHNILVFRGPRNLHHSYF